MTDLFDDHPDLQPVRLDPTNRIFKFEEKQAAALIDISDLRHTRTLKDHRGKLPESRPLEHVQFIDMVNDILVNKGMEVTTPEIYVSKSDSHYDDKMAAALGLPNTLEAWFFDRLICRINMPYEGDYNPSVAIGYNARGLALAYGTNVRICQNMSIFGDKFLRTYDSGLPFNRMMELFVGWINEFQKHFEYDMAILQRMKNTYLGNTLPELQKMIGTLHLLATEKNMGAKVLAPLNQTQVNEFSRKVLEMGADGKINLSNDENVISMHDLYNIGTQILTHSQTNLEYKWDKVSEMGAFFETHYLN